MQGVVSFSGKEGAKKRVKDQNGVPIFATQYTLQRQHCELHYWLTGPEDAPLVVFTHGVGMDHHMFEAQVQALADSYRILTWDVRGHGLSKLTGTFSLQEAMQDLLAILDQLGYAKATLVGQSLGGYIGQMIAYHHPQRVTALVLISCTPITDNPSFLQRIQRRLSGLLIDLLPYPFIKAQASNYTTVRSEVQAYAANAIGQVSKRDFAQIWRQVMQLHYDAPGYQIEPPSLLAYGAYDAIKSVTEEMPKWAARNPNSHCVVIPGAGHNANQDNPTFCNKMIADFLDEFVAGSEKSARLARLSSPNRERSPE